MPDTREEQTAAVEAREYVFVQAHRGSTTAYPELTLAAVEASIEAGADRIEMDLALTADGNIVLMHDATVDRTTDGTGRVDSLSLREIKSLDAGSWHSERFAGETVPTLREVIEMVDGRAELNLEIKTNDRPWRRVERTIAEATELVAELGASSWVVYSSFDSRALLGVRALVPDARLILIDWRPESRYDGLDLSIDMNFYGWTPSQDHISASRVRRARRAGLWVHVGASPGPRALEYVGWGVDGLSSGNPESIIRYLEGAGLRKRPADQPSHDFRRRD